LRQRGAGKIIFIGSGMGHRGVSSRSDYCVSKAGLRMLTRIRLRRSLPTVSASTSRARTVNTDLSTGQRGSRARRGFCNGSNNRRGHLSPIRHLSRATD
jgi:NAD(P)-dependent dehydrogenase (short-subunit alcohol dehydrogenase family)